jgi:SAM-dependent methyltransferase
MSEYNPGDRRPRRRPDRLRANRPLIGDAATLPAAAPQEGHTDIGGAADSDDPAVEGGNPRAIASSVQKTRPTMHEAKAAVAGVFDRAANAYGRSGADFFGHAGRMLVRAVDRSPAKWFSMSALVLVPVRSPRPRRGVRRVGSSPSTSLPQWSGAFATRRPTVGSRSRGAPRRRGASMGAEDGVDAVLAGFVLFFLPEPLTALQRYSTALRPGGRFGASWFGDDDARWKPVFEAIQPYQRSGPPAPPRHPLFASVEALQAALVDAGFASATTTEEEYVLHFADAEQWYAWSWSHGMRGMWERIPDDKRDAARAAATEAMQATYDEAGAPTLRVNLRYTIATR